MKRFVCNVYLKRRNLFNILYINKYLKNQQYFMSVIVSKIIKCSNLYRY